MPRPSGRRPDELRRIEITRHYTKYAEGSALFCIGDTRVLCTASVEEKVPPWLRGKHRGWVTAEYNMLARATNLRVAGRGAPNGRAVEIQRLIGRSLRAAVDLKKLGERSIIVDCDVLQADGGTRAAAICGGYVAVADAINWLRAHALLDENPLRRMVAAISVGVGRGEVVTDLDYAEDSRAELDMNVVLDDRGGLLEIQGGVEKFNTEMDRATLNKMLDQAQAAGAEILRAMQDALATD